MEEEEEDYENDSFVQNDEEEVEFDGEPDELMSGEEARVQRQLAGLKLRERA